MLTPEAVLAVDGVSANDAGEGRPFGSFCVYDSRTPFVVRPLGHDSRACSALQLVHYMRVNGAFTASLPLSMDGLSTRSPSASTR